MTEDEIDRIARELLAARAENRTVPAGAAPDDTAGAYAVQDAIERILTGEGGARAIGYKIGATNAAARGALGVDGSFRGRLYDISTSGSGATLAHRPALHKVWEVEIAIELGRDLDPAKAPFDAAAIEAATRALLPAIEVVGTVFAFPDAGPVNLISDNAVHGHWIVGAPVTDWRGFDLVDGPITLTINGDVAAEGRGGNVDGGPFGATADILNELARQGRGMKAGEFVTTGTVTPLIPIAGPASVLADFGPLGQVGLELV